MLSVHKRPSRIGLKARRTRMITASAMMKMHVPAYWPCEPGVHSVEKRGVLKETKKVIAMSAIDMDMSDMPDMPDMDDEVDVAMDMPVAEPIDIAVVVAMDIVVDMSDMSILAIQLVKQ